MLTKILEFLVGSPPDIFAEDGTVRHKLPKKKWEAWQKRYQSSPEYNWKNHTGTKAGSSNKKNH